MPRKPLIAVASSVVSKRRAAARVVLHTIFTVVTLGAKSKTDFRGGKITVHEVGYAEVKFEGFYFNTKYNELCTR